METSELPLKIYIYTQQRDGFIFPLDSAPLAMFSPPDERYFHAVDAPDDADFVVLPYPLGTFVDAVGLQMVTVYLQILPFYDTFPHKHVFFLWHDDSRPTGLDGVFFRIGANRFHHDENTIAMPYESDDFAEIATADFAALPFDTTFLGYTGLTDLRPRMVASVQSQPEIAAWLNLRAEFHNHVDKHHSAAEKEARRAEYLDSLAKSRTVLCPRGEGEGSIRFFETMSAGRIPVWLADEFVLPFADEINYAAFSLQIPQSRVDETGAILAQFLAEHTSAELQTMGRMARRAWEDFLSDAVWPRMVFRSLVKLKARTAAIPPQKKNTLWAKGDFWGAWQVLFTHGRALLPHSRIVAITADAAPVAALAHGLDAAHNSDSRLTVIPLLENIIPELPAGVDVTPGNPVLLHENFPVRSLNLLFLGGFSSADSVTRLLDEWFFTLGHGGIIVGVDESSERETVRAAEKFAEKSSYFSFSEIVSTPEQTVYQLEYRASAEFKALIGMPAVPPVPADDTPSASIVQLDFPAVAPLAELPPVSLCMIVKNEEDNLVDCLRSVGDFASEMIIVDTGSTDRTVQIAESFGARVFHFQWMDDFAAARNESLRHATGEWIFWLDADDRIPPASLAKLKQAVASARADAFRCRMVSPLAGDAPAVNSVFYTLLFRNGRGVQFEDPIHESPTDSAVRHGLRLANTNIEIEHHGYTGDAAQLRRKAERNVRILRRCAADEPDKLKWRYHLGVGLYQLDDFGGAMAQLEPIVMHPAPELNEQNQVYRAHVLLLSAYANCGLFSRADALIAQAMRRYPLRRHLYVAIGMHYLHTGRPADAAKMLEKARAIPAHIVEGEDWQPGVLESTLFDAYRRWSAAVLQQGDPLLAAELIQKAISTAQQPAQKAEGWKLMAVCLQKLGQEKEAMAAWQMAQQMTLPQKV